MYLLCFFVSSSENEISNFERFSIDSEENVDRILWMYL